MIVGLYSTNPQSGKSTVARLFTLAGYRRMSLAASVKKALHSVLMDAGVQQAHEYLWGDWKDEVIPEWGVTGGFLMSTFATDYMRNYVNENVWLNIVLRQMKAGYDYIIDDMRFPNEFNAVKDSGGYCIKIVRPDANERHGRSTASEGQLDNYAFDWILVNDGSLEDLEYNTRTIIAQIKEKTK